MLSTLLRLLQLTLMNSTGEFHAAAAAATNDESQPIKYAPAWQLDDGQFERLGRK